jgi:hypothetical protein
MKQFCIWKFRDLECQRILAFTTGIETNKLLKLVSDDDLHRSSLKTMYIGQNVSVEIKIVNCDKY